MEALQSDLLYIKVRPSHTPACDSTSWLLRHALGIMAMSTLLTNAWQYFPKDKKYVSLFPAEDSEAAAEQRARLKRMALRNYEEEKQRVADNPDAEVEADDEEEPSEDEGYSSESSDEGSNEELPEAPKDDFFL